MQKAYTVTVRVVSTYIFDDVIADNADQAKDLGLELAKDFLMTAGEKEFNYDTEAYLVDITE